MFPLRAGAAGAALAVAGLIAVVGCGSGGTSADETLDRAYLACQDFISPQIQGTPHFPGVTSGDYPTISSTGNNSYEVVGTVTTAVATYRFDCRTTKQADGSWSDDGTTVN